MYALNATGKSTLCDLFRSLGTNDPAYVVGRKRFGATGDIEAELLLRGDPPIPKVKWVNTRWEFDPTTHQIPPILVFDDRFVADNVFIGGFVDVEHRRNLYGLALGENGKRLKERVDQADQALSVASTALAEARSQLVLDGALIAITSAGTVASGGTLTPFEIAATSGFILLGGKV